MNPATIWGEIIVVDEPTCSARVPKRAVGTGHGTSSRMNRGSPRSAPAPCDRRVLYANACARIAPLREACGFRRAPVVPSEHSRSTSAAMPGRRLDRGKRIAPRAARGQGWRAESTIRASQRGPVAVLDDDLERLGDPGAVARRLNASEIEARRHEARELRDEVRRRQFRHGNRAVFAGFVGERGDVLVRLAEARLTEVCRGGAVGPVGEGAVVGGLSVHEPHRAERTEKRNELREECRRGIEIESRIINVDTLDCLSRAVRDGELQEIAELT